MNRHGLRSIFILIVFSFFLGPVSPANSGQCLLVSSPGVSQIKLGDYVSMLPDQNGNWSITDIAGPKLNARFAPPDASRISIPGPPALMWVRFKITIPATVSGKSDCWILEIDNPELDMVELYLPDTEAPNGYRRVDGDQRGLAAPENVLFRSFAFKLNPTPNEVTTYYLHLGSNGPGSIPLTLYGEDAFRSHSMYDYLYFGMVYGCMLSMILYNLFIYFSLRAKIYMIYVSYMLCFLAYFLVFNGHVSAAMDIGQGVSQVLEWVFLGASIYFSISFCRQFFTTGRNTPIWDKVLVFFQATALSIILLGMLRMHSQAALVANWAGAIGPVNFFIVAGIRWRQGFGSAKYYILANLSFIVGTSVYIIWTMGLVQEDIPSNLIFTLGPALEAVLLSFALADRIRMLEKQAQDLSQSRARYKKASETDGLTGLYNKRYLLEKIEREVKDASALEHPLSFFIMDVDNFKRFNDTYGHPEGDKVLKALADVINEGIRDHDCSCRYGGEEFTVILPNTSMENAYQVAERIRKHFAARTFKIGNRREVSATVSIGLAQYKRGENSTELIRKADKALYRAKHEGKNRVILAD